jgi:hypothetical protein
MVPSTQAEYRLIPPADHKLMRTRWISFHEQNWSTPVSAEDHASSPGVLLVLQAEQPKLALQRGESAKTG